MPLATLWEVKKGILTIDKEGYEKPAPDDLKKGFPEYSVMFDRMHKQLYSILQKDTEKRHILNAAITSKRQQEEGPLGDIEIKEGRLKKIIEDIFKSASKEEIQGRRKDIGVCDCCEQYPGEGHCEECDGAVCRECAVRCPFCNMLVCKCCYENSGGYCPGCRR